jgi:hypothetical protein
MQKFISSEANSALAVERFEFPGPMTSRNLKNLRETMWRSIRKQPDHLLGWISKFGEDRLNPMFNPA